MRINHTSELELRARLAPVLRESTTTRRTVKLEDLNGADEDGKKKKGEGE